MTKKMITIAGLILTISTLSCSQSKSDFNESAVAQEILQDEYTLIGEKSFLTGYEPLNFDGSINVVIEIPAGTTAKWEVIKPNGALKWEFENGKPRVVRYLGYPGNYGMVPKTLLPKEMSGDGDPLDVIVLGSAASRGTVVRAKLLGVLKLLDGGEQDDKLLAVLANTPLFDANNLDELRQKFPGVTEIVETWFVNYKGPGEMESKGFRDVDEAQKILENAIRAFNEIEVM